jgi:hypothetical protein
MRVLFTASSLVALLALSACGPAPTAAQAPAEPSPPRSEPKCPDPSIKDATNPCSPNYYKPVKGSFKGQKSF